MADRPIGNPAALTADRHAVSLLALHHRVDPLLTACRALIAAHDSGRSRTVAIEAIRAALAAFAEDAS